MNELSVTYVSQKPLNIFAAIGQGSFLGLTPQPKSSSSYTIFLILFIFLDLLKQALGLRPFYIPINAPTGQVCLFSVPGSAEAIAKMTDGM